MCIAIGSPVAHKGYKSMQITNNSMASPLDSPVRLSKHSFEKETARIPRRGIAIPTNRSGRNYDRQKPRKGNKVYEPGNGLSKRPGPDHRLRCSLSRQALGAVSVMRPGIPTKSVDGQEQAAILTIHGGWSTLGKPGRSREGSRGKPGTEAGDRRDVFRCGLAEVTSKAGIKTVSRFEG